MPSIKHTTIIIVGVTGDLSRRYLLPALDQIIQSDQVEGSLQIVGTSRNKITASDLLSSAQTPLNHIEEHFNATTLDPAKREDYEQLHERLHHIESSVDGISQRVFYLSVPPQVSWPVIELLGQNGFADHPHTKLLLEKPFGVDLASATQLIEHTQRYFSEEQVYRIDHYLAKEMAQNLIVFRDSNPLIKHTWSNDFIDRIDIKVLESIDIEGRAGFYEQTGALRDVLQSHGLQLAALTLMNIEDGEDVPSARLNALKNLRLPELLPVGSSAIRGQYAGYRDEVQVPHSNVETFAQVTLSSSDKRWTNVPITITTGKALPEKETSVTLTYRSEDDQEPNRLILRIQPDAGIDLMLWSKTPGYTHKIDKRSLHFDYREEPNALPEAYEQVLLDAIQSNHRLFTSSDEVLESWRILEPVRHAWDFSTQDLAHYPKGTYPQLDGSTDEGDAISLGQN